MRKCKVCKEHKEPEKNFNRSENGKYLTTCNQCKEDIKKRDRKCSFCKQLKPRDGFVHQKCGDCKSKATDKTLRKCAKCKQIKKSNKKNYCDDCLSVGKLTKCKRCGEKKPSEECTWQVCKQCKSNPKKRGRKESVVKEKKMRVDKVIKEPLTPIEVLAIAKEQEAKKKLKRVPIFKGYKLCEVK